MSRKVVAPPVSSAKPSWRMLLDAGLPTLLAAPVIYSLLLPLVLLDAWVLLYEAVCFPVYGIAKVPRARYFVFDRARLPYLNAIERLGCLYCSYANGLLGYAREVAARTEQYFCPIGHQRAPDCAHARYRHFPVYGDAAAFRSELERLRAALRPPL